MKKNTVVAFVGERTEIIRMYDAIKSMVDIELSSLGQEFVIKSAVDDYVRTIELGTELNAYIGYKNVYWVDPSGQTRVRFKEASDKIKSIKKRGGEMVAFSGYSEVELMTISNRLNYVGIDSVCVLDEKRNEWQLVVKPEDYFESVAIGSKLAEWKFKTVQWNDPTGAPMFNMGKLAHNARTELEDVLEA